MRTFHVEKATEFEEALVEHGIGFEHPNDDPNTFRISDESVDAVDDLARKMTVEVYIDDPFVTQQDTERD